jgi:WD40 repeat protein
MTEITAETPVTTLANPYVGPRSFQTNEKLYGRDLELRQLVDRLISERIVLLHSPSGAGKTSLVQAGLVPQMKLANFHVHSVIRVNLEHTRDLPCAGNRYTYSTLLSLEEGYPEDQRMDKDQLSCMSLDDYLLERARCDDRSQPELLIFDQFEEVLTIDPYDRETKKEFFGMLGTALRNRDRWVLFVMREDYVASLEPYVRQVPTYFANTFRLDLLGVAAAREAVMRPAIDAGIDFTSDAAKKLVDDLSRIQVMDQDGKMENRAGLYVEPVQLQVVCYRLWETVDLSDGDINLDDVTEIGDVDKSLSEYYAMSVGSVAKNAGVSERAIREWFQNRLITKEGIRGQVMMGATHAEGLQNKAVLLLENAHIIRAEKRAGVTWYELSHDRLIDPVRNNNQEWFDANLNLLQRQAVLWEQQSRSDGLLIRGKDLDEAEKQAGSIQLTAVETDFLAACRKLRKAEQREHRRNQIIMGLGVLAGIAFIVAMVFFGKAQSSAADARNQAATAVVAQQTAVSGQSTAEAAKSEAVTAKNDAIAAKNDAVAAKKEADTQKNKAVDEQQKGFARQLSAQASLITLERGRSAIYSGLLAVEGAQRLPSLEAGQALRRFLENTGLPVLREDTGGNITAIQYDAIDSLVMTANGNGAVQAWNPHTPGLQYQVDFNSQVDALVYNEKANLMAAGSSDGTVKIWDAATGDNVVTLNHNGAVNALDFRPDGQQLVTGSDDKTVKLWDAQSGEELRSWDAGSAVVSLAYNPNGTQVAASTQDGEFAILQPVALYVLYKIDHNDCNDVSSLTFNKDGDLLAGVCGNYAIVWDTPSGMEKQRKNHRYGVTSVRFSPDGQWLVSTGMDFNAIVWDPKTGVRQSGITQFNTVNGAEFSEDGQYLVSFSDDGTARVWNFQTGQIVKEMPFDSKVKASAFILDGQYIASGTSDGTFAIWQINAAGKDNLPILPQDTTRSVAFNQDGTKAYVANYAEIDVTDTGSRETKTLVSFPVSMNYVTFSPDGKWAVTKDYDTTTRVYELDNGNMLYEKTIPGQETIFSFSQDGKTIIASAGDNTADVWDTATGKEGGTMKHDNPISAVALSKDGTLAASVSSEGVVKVWNAANGNPITSVDQKDYVYSVAFSPDGQKLVTGNYNNTAVIWDVKKGTSLVTLQHDGTVNSASFNSDGTLVITAGYDGTARVWNANTGQEISHIVHDNSVDYAVFGPGDKYVVSGSQDRTVRVWDPQTGEEIASISYPDWVTALAISPDNQHVLSGSYAGASYWSIDIHDLTDEACKRLPRNFTKDEWNTYLKGVPYRDTCMIQTGSSIPVDQPQQPTTQITNYQPSSCSTSSDQAAQITFKNVSGQTLDAYWVDYSCVPQYYFSLDNGQEYTQ